MILQIDELCRHLKAFRSAGYKVVTTNGCFDLLHIGHTRYLQIAKLLGDILVVLVNGDSAVRSLKGKGRPFVPAEERAEVLDALCVVDYVVVFYELRPNTVLRKICPDVHVKGGDYVADDLPEARLVESLGGKIIIVDYIEGRSTSVLIDSIRQVQDNA